MKTRTFKMNGKIYTSMMDIARELGLKRVYPRDFKKLGIEELTDVQTDTADSSKEETVETTETSNEVKDSKDEETETEVSPEKEAEASQSQADEKPDDSHQAKVDKRFTRKTGTPEQIKEAQENATKVSVVEFNNMIKHFTVSALEVMANDAGVNAWESIESEPIRKMRLLMEIKAHYYPNDKTPVKPTSDWKKLELNELLKIADDHDVSYKTSDDNKIQRMWVTLALNKAGLNPSDYIKPKKQEEVVVVDA